MIGLLPSEIDGHKINTDYRVALLIFQAYADPNLNEYEKAAVCIECLYKERPKDIDKAYKGALWFLNGGRDDDEDGNIKKAKKIVDWEQDESMLFAAINKVAGKEVRAESYMHWWTFLGLFQEIGESFFMTVVGIRYKKNKGKKLEKHEQEFYRENKDLVDIKTAYSEAEQAEIDYFKKLLGE